MIRYSVQCSHGHVFEEWFSNSADYDVQAAAGAITCPDCGDTKVSKAIMAPSVAKGSAAPAPACGMGGCGGGSGGCPYAQDF